MQHLRKYALVAVGELLVDFISQEMSENLRGATHFSRFQGGSPANLAANMARLGNTVAVVSCVGNDNLGQYLREQVAATGADIRYLATDNVHPTSIVVVSRSAGTPDFIAYREADCQLHPSHLPSELLEQSAFFHTTCFALSRLPAQATILDAARRAVQAGCRLSIDVNYAPRIWPDRSEAMRVITEYCSHGTFVKVSLDDIARLFDDNSMRPEQAIDTFHSMGAGLVCLTMGADGSMISTDGEQQPVRLASQPVRVVDATGAGDAYWAGFLTAWLEGKSAEACGQAGSRLAALKLVTLGPLPAQVARESIL